MLHGLSLDMKYPVTATAESHGFKRPTIILVVQIRGANLAALGTPVGPHTRTDPTHGICGFYALGMKHFVMRLRRLNVLAMFPAPPDGYRIDTGSTPSRKTTPISRIALEELNRLGVVSMTLRTRS